MFRAILTWIPLSAVLVALSCSRTDTICIEQDAVTYVITDTKTTETNRRSCPAEDPPQICEDGSCVCAPDDAVCLQIQAEREEAARREEEERRRANCCRVCDTGKACGDTCIPEQNTCRTIGGCACNR